MTFLTNPPRKGRAAKRARKGAPGRAAQRRQSKRKPPKGFATWSAYMASIRPKRSGSASSAPKGEGMAKKKGKKRHAARSATARRNPARGSRKRGGVRRATARRARPRRGFRRNPPSIVSRVVPFAIDATRTAAGVLAGKIAARKVRGMIGQKAGTLLGSIAEAGVGVVAGLALAIVGHETDGVNVAAGGILAVGETLVQQAAIPHVSDALSDDGYLYGLNAAGLRAVAPGGSPAVPAIAAPVLNGPTGARGAARGTGAGVMVA